MLQLGGIKGDISAPRCNLSILHLSPLVSDHWPPISHIGDNSAKLGLGRRNYFLGLNHLQGPASPLLISTKLVQKNPRPNICAFPSLTGVFKKVVNSSLEGSMRLISSHPHDAKIGSLDQDHYFTVWCFQDCGEIVERHWADCRRVFAESSEIKVIIEVDTARSLRQQPSRVSCAAICRPFICQATSYQPLSRVRCPYQPRFSWSQLNVSRGNAQFDFCEIYQTHVELILRTSCWYLVKL